MKLLSIFQKNKKKGYSKLEDLTELNLFVEDIHSDSFLEKVKALKNINKKFENRNLLHVACEHNGLELARTVLELGINVEEKDDYGNTALWIAVFNSRGNYNLVDLLLKHKANPNSINKANISPLGFAKKINDEILISKLIATTTANSG